MTYCDVCGKAGSYPELGTLEDFAVVDSREGFTQRMIHFVAHHSCGANVMAEARKWLEQQLTTDYWPASIERTT